MVHIRSAVCFATKRNKKFTRHRYRAICFTCLLPTNYVRIAEGEYFRHIPATSTMHKKFTRHRDKHTCCNLDYIKWKAILATRRGCQWGCQTSRLPHCLDNRLREGAEVSLSRLSSPRKIPYRHFR
jgi:hypothetical protein